MTLLMITPLIVIVVFMVYKAWPVLSLDYILSNPIRGMREGGVWAPFLGTIYLAVSYTHLRAHET